MIIKPANTAQEIHDLKRRLDLDDTDYIIFESAFLFPLKLDHAVREFTESEQIEWLSTEVYPQLVEEGQMILNGKGNYVKAKQEIKE